MITELQEHRFINKQVVVSDASIRELQENVVESHAMRPSSRSLLRLLAEEGFYKKRLLLSSASSRRVRLDCAGDRELSEHHQARGFPFPPRGAEASDFRVGAEHLLFATGSTWILDGSFLFELRAFPRWWPKKTRRERERD